MISAGKPLSSLQSRGLLVNAYPQSSSAEKITHKATCMAQLQFHGGVWGGNRKVIRFWW